MDLIQFGLGSRGCLFWPEKFTIFSALDAKNSEIIFFFLFFLSTVK